MRRKQGSILSNEQGFTLIEIIAVLVILGILASVAVPKFMDLRDDARQNAADAAIAEVQARLSMAYGKYLLKNSGSLPDNIADLCGEKGVNDDNILPKDASGDVPMGDDFKVSLDGTTDKKKASISVGEVQGNELDPAVTGTWDLPS